MVQSMFDSFLTPPKSFFGNGLKGWLAHDTPLSLLPHNLLDLADLFLNFAGYLFIDTFSFQLWIHR